MKDNKRKKIIIFFVVCISFFIVSSITYGKYVYNSVFDYYLKSKGFYFSSDNLDINTAKNVDNLWDGTNVEFNIKNSINKKLITSYDINYSVTCTVISDNASNVECRLNDTNSNIFSGVLSSDKVCINNTNDSVDVSAYTELNCLKDGYSWEDKETVGELSFNVFSKDSKYQFNDVSVNISVSSTSPYKKTIDADFVLHKVDNEEKITTLYKTYTNNDRLIISNSYLEEREVTISWNASDYRIGLDSSVTVLSTDSNNYINSIKIIIPSKQSVGYKFYKTTANVTDVANDFTISSVGLH